MGLFVHWIKCFILFDYFLCTFGIWSTHINLGLFITNNWQVWHQCKNNFSKTCRFWTYYCRQERNILPGEFMSEMKFLNLNHSQFKSCLQSCCWSEYHVTTCSPIRTSLSYLNSDEDEPHSQLLWNSQYTHNWSHLSQQNYAVCTI